MRRAIVHSAVTYPPPLRSKSQRSCKDTPAEVGDVTNGNLRLSRRNPRRVTTGWRIGHETMNGAMDLGYTLDAFRHGRLQFSRARGFPASWSLRLSPRRRVPYNDSLCIRSARGVRRDHGRWSSQGCKASGVGDPCIPEKEFDQAFLGFDPGRSTSSPRASSASRGSVS